MPELVIPYNSKPDYDDWGTDGYWNLATWVAWHRGLSKQYGRSLDKDGYPLADKIWLNAWAKQTSYSSPILAVLQPTRFKSETDYLKKFPLLYEYTSLKTASEQVNPLDSSYQNLESAQNVGNNLIQSVENVSDSVSNTTKAMKYVLPIILIGAGTIALIWGYNKFVKN